MTYTDEDDNRWSLMEEMEKLFETALQLSFPNLSDEYEDVEDPCFTNTLEKEMGDFECVNVVSMCLKKTPETMLLKHTAEAIKNNLPPNDMIEDCRIQCIGFLTFRISTTWIAKSVHKMLNDGIETLAPKLPMKSAIVNVSSRNIAQEMNLRHLRPVIIGDMLARMLEFSNVHVEPTNHVGDCMQYGMLIQLLNETRYIGGEFEVLFEESKKKFDEDAEFRERAHEAQLGLQIGDKDYLHTWVHIRRLDLICYGTVYKRLGIYVEELGRYCYCPHNQETLNLLKKEDLIEESEGDKVIFAEERKSIRHHVFKSKKKPLTVVKKNGYYDNALADLTALRHGLTEQKADWVVYVADVGRKEYIEMCFSAARRAGWLPTDEDEYPRTKFVGCGLVQGDDLNRSVKVVDLLEDAKIRCKAALLERVEADEFPAEELENTAEALSYGAVKYALMKDFRVFSYTLNVDDMLNDKGNTGVYLLYTHARICSIINKSGRDIEELKKTRELNLVTDDERELGLHLLNFTEVVELTCTTVFPCNLCAYLYELCKRFTNFYSVMCQAVVCADEEPNGLLVCEATRVVMAKSFHLLGITPIGKISISENLRMPALVERDDNDKMESLSSDRDKEEMVSTSSSSSGEDKEDTVSSSSGEGTTPAKRFKSTDLSLEEEEKKKMTPLLEPIISSEDLTLDEEKEPNPRFQLFSAHVHVDIYTEDCKPCFVFGSIRVSDMFVSSEANGWVSLFDPDYGYTDLFDRDWSEALPIVNNDYINALTHPRTQRSIPFTDFLDIRADLHVFSKDDNIIFRVSNSYTCLGLQNITYDEFSTQVLHGHDGFVELVYNIISDPVDAALEMMFTTHPADSDVSNKPLSVKIFAYYGRAGYDYDSMRLKKGSCYLTLLEDASVTISDNRKIPLNTSVLAVPAKGSLAVDVLIKDFNGNVIVKEIFDFPAQRKGSSDGHFEGVGCSFDLNVNWK